MKRLFSLVSIVVYSAAVFMAGMMVGQLYALYVLVYTGAVLMVGVYVGERLERKQSLPPEIPSVDDPPAELSEARESDELTLKH